MAFYSSFKLPPLRVSTNVSGSLSTNFAHRGSHWNEELGTPIDSTTCNTCDTDQPEPVDTQQMNEPSFHELERQAAARGWNQLRGSLLSAAVESASMPANRECVMCSELALFRCLECGPAVHYCETCFCHLHKKTNVFHVAEKWEGNHYSIHSFGAPTISVVEPHSCSKPVIGITLRCVDERGMEHSLNFRHCQCELLPVALIRASMWPASPQFPRLCFSFKLLDWVEALLLECQVALKDFCRALYFQCPYRLRQRRDIYAALIDSFEEYRIFKHEMRHLHFLCNGLDEGNVCPACPKEVGTLVLSMDGLFGLPRKKSAGTSCQNAVHGHLFFCDQIQVDEYVQESSGSKAVATECNEFLAGNVLRSASRFYKLDETAAFGSICRHDFPSLFLNLKHGERLSYGVFLIDSILEKYISQNVYIMYDVACTLHKHLKLCGRDDTLERIHLCLPSFHSYGHKVSCQVVYGPLRCSGIGLSDGEGMERLWSYLRRFNRMTKEMRPAHRINVLSHALVYYGLRKKEKLCKSLVMRWQRARNVYDASHESFAQLSSMQGTCISEETVCKWLAEERSIGSTYKCAFSSLPQWKCEYFLLLHPFLTWSQKIKDGMLSREEQLCGKHEITRLDKLLKEAEKKHHITCRWSESDHVYTQVHRMFSEERRVQIGKAIWTASATRQFLLDLKAKYADGQKIAKKLCSQITNETKSIKALLPEYNACLLASGVVESVDIKQALNPSELAALIPSSSSFASGPKRALIDSYIMMKRSAEEMELLESEMGYTMCHYSLKTKTIDDTLALLSERDDKYSKGAVALLLKLRVEVDEQIALCTQLFSVNQGKPQPVIPLIGENDSESEIDSDISSGDEGDDNFIC